MSWLLQKIADGTAIAFLVHFTYKLVVKLFGQILFYSATKFGEDAVLDYLKAHGYIKHKHSE